MENCERALSDSMSTMSYRGPDASGNFNGERTRGFFGLGHVRLSILDLTEGANQPYQSKCGRYSLVFNGEIYNYRELREELKANGEVFVSRSDTEVLLNSYLAYGSKCLERLNGMFAFAIYDLELNKLFLARDHIGIKPIYYYYDPTSTDFYFASEIKALKEYPDVDASLSKEDVFEFFNNGWLYEPNTGYEFIKKIPPGCFAELSFSGDLVLERYFHLVKEAAKRTSAAEDKLPVLLKQALRLQYNADVPVGLFFSGGTDSTIIAGFSPGRPKSIYASYDASALKKSGVVDDELYVDPIKNELNFDVEVIHCNENGYFSIYKSDRFGFNNPDDVWDDSIDLIVLGDSFVHGACVNSGDDMSSQLRKIGKFNVINLGWSNTGPLRQYAAFVEYVEKYPRYIIWVYYENDLDNLNDELNTKLLKKYLNDGNFKQNLTTKNKRKEIDKLIMDKHVKYMEHEHIIDTRVKFYNNFINYLKLYKTRQILLSLFKNFSKQNGSLNSNYYSNLLNEYFFIFDKFKKKS